MPWPGQRSIRAGTQAASPDAAITDEWPGRVCIGYILLGIITRRYHGYLVAALPAPFGRVMMFNDLVRPVELPNGKRYQLGGEERAGVPLKLEASEFLSEFRLEGGLPVWRYELEDAVVDTWCCRMGKTLCM